MRDSNNFNNQNNQTTSQIPPLNTNNYAPPPQYGGYMPPKKPSNGPLIAVICVIGGLILILGIVLLLVFTRSIISSDSTLAPTATAPTVTAAPVVPQENTAVIAQKFVANVKYSIYLRSEPVENDSNIICEIPLGTQVGFIENSNTVFSKINYNGTIGYSKTQYLSDYMPNISANTTVSSYMYIANVKYSVYFRSEPQENSGNIICEIPVNTMVGFIEKTDTVFSKINYNGSIGYVKSQYLSSAIPHQAYSSSTMTVVNVAHSIYLRSTPSEASNNNIIMEIPVGATVTYLDTPDSTFHKISYGGTVGYSKQIYLSFN